MGCSSCGTGTPNGCKSNGGCSTGGCNRLNVHDWLLNLPVADPESVCKVMEVSFNNGSRKDFYRNNTLQWFDKGEYVTIEGVSGFDVGEVTLTGEMVRLQMKKKGVDEFSSEMKRVLRRSTEKDLEMMEQHKAREKNACIRARAITRQLKLDMKMSEVEFQADGRKATFYYIADDRVDFRELIKILAGEFKVKVEMRQIGARQEAGKVGGIGSCGRELCCSTWLTEFKSVNTTAARYQNLSINQTKLSGQCGRLKCCLNYELDTYLDALQQFPENADTIQVARGTAILIKKDIFRNLMWYVLQESNKHYPLTIERVKKIKRLNAQGVIPEELEPVEVTTGKPKEVEPEFVDVVGQITLRSLEKSDRKKRNQKDGPREPRGPQQGPRGPREQPEGRNDQRPPRPDQRNTGNAAPRENRPDQQRPPRGGQPPRNGQPPREGQSRDGQPRDAQNRDRQPRDGQPRDGQPRDGQPRDGQQRGGQPREGQRDGQPRNQQPRDGQPRDGQPRDGQPRDGQPRGGGPRNAPQGDRPLRERPPRDNDRPPMDGNAGEQRPPAPTEGA